MAEADSIPFADRRPGADFEAQRIRAAVRRHFLGTPALVVGRYEVGRNLGAGGSGSVYRAHDPVLDREVAVKLLHQSSRRLKREAAALALLDHPHVVRVLDYVGTSDKQAMVMELVPGVSLRDWLDARPRSIADIVQRFTQAGRGLAAVHAHGLVHRDFKPENVVVDAAGNSRLVDFGLVRSYAAAKPTPAEGTPRYMAPEQRRGEAPDPAADQYSFCVALHESLHAGDSNVPSVLDAVLRRGMAADPSRRWPSVAALLRRLGRATKPGSSWLLPAIVAAVALAAWLATGMEHGVAVHQREVQCTDAIARALPPLDVPLDPSWGNVEAGVDAYRRRWPAVRASVCDASPVDELRVGCLLDAEVHYAVWLELLRDGSLDNVSLAAQSVARFPNLEVCIGPAPPEATMTGSNRAAMARLARANFAWTLGDYERSAAESEAVWAALSPEDDCATRAFAANIHGLAQQRLGEPKEALMWFDRSIYDAMACNDHGTVADSAGRALQIASHDLGQDDALARYGKIAEAALERAGNPPRRLAIFLGARSLARIETGEYELGVADMRRAAAVMEDEVGPNSYELVAYLSNLGSALRMTQQPREATEHFERAYRLTVAERGEDSRAALSLQSSLAGLDMVRGDQQQALRRLRTNLEHFERRSGGVDRDMLTTLLSLAEIELSRRELQSAKTHYQRALDVIGDPASEPRRSSVALARLGTIAGEEGDFERAEQLLQRARVVQSEQFGVDNEETAWTMMQLGILRTRQDRWTDALDIFDSIAATVATARQANLISTFHVSVAEAEAGLGRREQALASARRAVEVDGIDGSQVAGALFVLARLERDAGDEPSALEHAREAQQRYSDTGDPRSGEVEAWLADSMELEPPAAAAAAQ